ncbi:MAG: hypothetical protein ACYS0D_06970, partial [Planctomycetota bacterium]
IVELTIVVVTLALLLALVVPVTARVRGDSGVAQSMSNLAAISVAHALYAWDLNGRQLTYSRDDLGFYDSVDDWGAAHGGCDTTGDPGCHPSITAGFSCDAVLYGYWSWSSGYTQWAFEPANFPEDGLESVNAWGTFRLINSNPFHNYLNGRYQDPLYYAPNDVGVFSEVVPCLGSPCEFLPFADSGNCNPAWSSYSMSPAAMFHPDVMRSNAAGGWQDPWSLDYGFESPSLFQALYPALKTLTIEHHWNQDPPDIYNPNTFEPYYFNHGIDSTPLALFYDGGVRLFPNTEALAADQQILDQTGGTDGLWHRGTPFGEEGFFITDGYDGAPISHHILTTNGILGRDTLAETSAVLAASLSWDPIPVSGSDSSPAARQRATSPPKFIVGGEP